MDRDTRFGPSSPTYYDTVYTDGSFSRRDKLTDEVIATGPENSYQTLRTSRDHHTASLGIGNGTTDEKAFHSVASRTSTDLVYDPTVEKNVLEDLGWDTTSMQRPEQSQIPPSIEAAALAVSC